MEKMMTDGIMMTWVLNLKPDAADLFWADVAAGVSGTRSFPGCRRAFLYRNQADPNQIMLTSEWDSYRDYEKYSAWRAASGRLLAGVPGSEVSSLLASPSVRQFWDVRI